MSTLDTAEALGVAPNTVRLWMMRFDLPTAIPTGGRRAFNTGDVILLREAMCRHATPEAAFADLRARLAA